MKLTYQQGHKSIYDPKHIGDDCTLPDFTVLTGLNGSGKTHLLEAIKHGRISCDDIDPGAISLLTFENLIEQQASATRIKAQCDAWLKETLDEKISAIYRDYLVSTECEEIHILLEEADGGKPVYSLEEHEVSPSLWEKIRAFKQAFGNEIFGNEQFRSFPYREYIRKSFIQYGVASKEQGFHYSRFVDIVGVQTLEELTEIFVEYQKAGEAYAQKQFEANKSGTRSDIIEEYYEGRPKPWSIINDALSALRTDPADDIDRHFAFQIWNPDERQWGDIPEAKIVNKSTGGVLSFDKLSSGEKVVLSLILMAVKSDQGAMPLQLLLLDEIDATLHPSMIKMMKNIIDDVFLDQGTKVILATHSPTTVSLMDESSIHVVRPGSVWHNRKIEKATKSESLEVLTEGYVTLDDLLTFSKVSREFIVLSEGRNYQFLCEAAKYFDPDNQIEILKTKDFSCDQILKLYEFLREVNGSRKFVAVWDCDYLEGKDEKRSELLGHGDKFNRAYILEKHENSEYARGIENLFDRKDTEGLGFDAENGRAPKDKRGFENAILQKASQDVFSNFRPLFEFILRDGK